jgi:hypothetical protein
MTLKESDKIHLEKFNKFMGHIENNVRIKNIKSNGKLFVAYR